MKHIVMSKNAGITALFSTDLIQIFHASITFWCNNYIHTMSIFYILLFEMWGTMYGFISRVSVSSLIVNSFLITTKLWLYTLSSGLIRIKRNTYTCIMKDRYGAVLPLQAIKQLSSAFENYVKSTHVVITVQYNGVDNKCK